MYKWVKILEFTTFYQNALHLSSMYYATFCERMSHRRAVLVFHVDSSEPSEPIKCSDRVLFEMGGVLLNLFLAKPHDLTLAVLEVHR